jgi:hypothetical protein
MNNGVTDFFEIRSSLLAYGPCCLQKTHVKDLWWVCRQKQTVRPNRETIGFIGNLSRKQWLGFGYVVILLLTVIHSSWVSDEISVQTLNFCWLGSCVWGASVLQPRIIMREPNQREKSVVSKGIHWVAFLANTPPHSQLLVSFGNWSGGHHRKITVESFNSQNTEVIHHTHSTCQGPSPDSAADAGRVLGHEAWQGQAGLSCHGKTWIKG